MNRPYGLYRRCLHGSMKASTPTDSDERLLVSKEATPLPPLQRGAWCGAPKRLPLSGVCEAVSAVVNDSPVDCQSRRPDRPQAIVIGDLSQ